MRCLAAGPFRKLATLGALALALLLGACGLKGALDPPPAPPKAQAQAQGDGEAAPPAPGETPQPPPRKRFFLDFLLN